MTKIKKPKKTRQIVPHGQAHITASCWSAGFKGAREATPYAAQVVAEEAIAKAKTLHSIESVDVYLKGIWMGREQAIRGLVSGGVDIKAIFDVTPVPHNWCRKKKVRKL